jgi:hypothetical protein
MAINPEKIAKAVADAKGTLTAISAVLAITLPLFRRVFK